MSQARHIGKPSVHFIGIGGTGMCGIAEVLLNLDYNVSGTVIEESDVTQIINILEQ